MGRSGRWIVGSAGPVALATGGLVMAATGVLLQRSLLSRSWYSSASISPRAKRSLRISLAEDE
jgi:hypothetical protein